MEKNMEFKHKSVLLQETIDNLNIRPDGIYVDGTLADILMKLPAGFHPKEDSSALIRMRRQLQQPVNG